MRPTMKVLTSILSNFFDFLSSDNIIFPDLLKVKVDEFDDVLSYKYQLFCYTRNRTMSSKMYEKFCNYDRDLVVNIMVTTASSYDTYYDNEDSMEVIKVLNLGKDFCNF